MAKISKEKRKEFDKKVKYLYSNEEAERKEIKAHKRICVECYKDSDGEEGFRCKYDK